VRILYLSASGELGGGERSLLDIVASLRRAQPAWPLHLVAAANGALLAQASALGVATDVVPFGPALSRVGESVGRAALALSVVRAAVPAAAYLGELRRVIQRVAPDVLHTNSLKMHVLGARTKPKQTALIWHLHDYVGARPLTARLLRWHAAACAAMVANSQSVADDARAALGGRVPVIPIHNGIDLQRFSTAGARLDLDALAGLPGSEGDVVRVGLVATFGHWKGHKTFLEAVRRLPADSRVRAYVVGGALYQTAGSQLSLDELRRYAAALGVSDRVGFTGFVNHPEEALRSLDIVVHASTAPEPFGLVIAEAMACGRAVIASDAGGAREIFTPGVDALTHPPGDAESLAARILELASDRDRRARLGRAGRETAERRFDRRRLATDLVPVYNRATAHA
jgi:glycosyltransferase involved in cell wall biosynthesis